MPVNAVTRRELHHSQGHDPQTSQKIAHFLLDFVCKQSLSGG
jgi:hypothetical protein